MQPDKWKSADDLNKEYNDLNLNKFIIDYEKYKLYDIVTNSTQLEGSTLDKLDTKLLLDDGLTAKGKPFLHHLMVKDNYEAILFAIQSADKGYLLSPEFLKELNAKNMATTGSVVNTLHGATVDGTKGEFRQDSRFAQAIGTYPDWKKIPNLVDAFCKAFNGQISNNQCIEQLKTSFDAHVNLVLIHPWMDGNKRTSRLLMNFIQRRAGLPLTKIDPKDSKEYILALKNAFDTGSLEVTRSFLLKQHIKTLKKEITEFKKNHKRGNNFSLIL
jgi:Fic family protein